MQGEYSRENKGITLIALVVTIVVLVILGTISITAAIGDDGLLARVKESKNDYEKAKADKEATVKDLLNEMAEDTTKVNSEASNSIPDPDPEPVETISKSTSYVGYYADIDADGTVDGVIYADLAIGGSATWGAGISGAYSAITGTKDYYISAKNYAGVFGNKDVLSPTGSGKDRFYVMALNDVNPGNGYCWYNAAVGMMSDYASATSISFGAGKKNTTTMVSKWNAEAYGTKNSDGVWSDVWGVIQDKVNNGWFVPSKIEWVIFAGALGISTDISNAKHYMNVGLRNRYWSSSQNDAKYAWYALFSNGRMSTDRVDSRIDTINDGYYVRLSTTF